MNKTIHDVREFWNARPCNIKHSQKPVGTLEYFEESKQRKFFVEPHIPAFADYAKWRGKKVLEIGCGIGCESIEFAKAGAILTSVDLSNMSLSIARERALVYGVNITFIQADAEHLSDYVPVEQYDLIYSFGVIHHTPHPHLVLDEIKKFIGPESILKIMVYHKISWKVLWIILGYGLGAFWNIDKLIARHSEAQVGCPVTYAYTKRSIRDLLKGFQILDIKVDHIFPYRIKHYKEYRYKKVCYFRWIPQRIFKFLEGLFGWHLCVTARLNDTMIKKELL